MTAPEELHVVFNAGGRSGFPGYALAAAAIGELQLAGRIAILDQFVQLREPTPTGNPVLDRVLTQIRDSHPRKVSTWILRLGHNGTVRRSIQASNQGADAIVKRLRASLENIDNAPPQDRLELAIVAHADFGLLGRKEKTRVISRASFPEIVTGLQTATAATTLLLIAG